MFSRRMMGVIMIAALVAVMIIVVIFNSRPGTDSVAGGRPAIALIAPFQQAVHQGFTFFRDIWIHYFDLVAASRENADLRQQLAELKGRIQRCEETERSNRRLREFLNFQDQITGNYVAGEVIGVDTSFWFKSVVIDKGLADGVTAGMPVVVPDGVVGQVAETSRKYSRVLLINDRNSAIDALVQRNRARGIVKGGEQGDCLFSYALRKEDIMAGDVIITSGLDGVYPKGLAVGTVARIRRTSAGIFQDVVIAPNVSFEKLEEVLVLLNPIGKRLEMDISEDAQSTPTS
ncbi:MAG: rod shape-determining protein MreC [Deltaproteobacteria bacterium]|nr:MAG: rod shape-determining protein MreC [Deltaproteobacteria bacterium]